MKMPDKCQRCSFLTYYANSGNVWCNATNRLIETGWHTEIDIKRQADCPLVEIPPHGRLIDADALHVLFENQWHYLQCLNWDENPKAEAIQTGINWCINTMHDDAPTVIEAEEDQEE